MGSGIILVGYAFSEASARQVGGVFYLGSIAICAGLLASSIIMRNWTRESRADVGEEQFWRDLEPLIFDQERIDRAADECATVLRALDLRGSLHILDAGCGPGRHAHQFAFMGHNVEGIDVINYL